MEVIAAKEEYTNRLVDILTPFLYKGINKLWVSTRKRVESMNKQHVIIPFQKELEQIPKWNQDIIDQQFSELLKTVDEKPLDKLIEAVFVSNVHILSSIRNKSQVRGKLDINIPDSKVFMHRCYVNCARILFTVPYLLDDRRNLGTIKRQENFTLCIQHIQESIHKTIRENLPINDIIEFNNTDSSLFEPEPSRRDDTESDEDSDSGSDMIEHRSDSDSDDDREVAMSELPRIDPPQQFSSESSTTPEPVPEPEKEDPFMHDPGTVPVSYVPQPTPDVSPVPDAVQIQAPIRPFFNSEAEQVIPPRPIIVKPGENLVRPEEKRSFFD
jgi:hypothetical protein